MRGEIIADIDNSGRTHTLFKFMGDSDTPEPNKESLQMIGISEEAAMAMIADAAAKRRSY